MSTQHALLISLIEKPSSGYDLARRFDRSIGYFWHATHQQIYRELGRMADHGWIAADEQGNGASNGTNGGEPAEADGVEKKSRKKVYRVLPAGRDELARWVLAPGLGIDQREEILVKLRADAAIGPLGLADEMARLIALHEARLETFLKIEQKDFAAGQADRTRQIHHALLRRGIRYEEDWVKWAKDLLPLLAAPAASDNT
ncbi:DNA-binding transcriptional regulator, PadR family [Cupriavidus sp. OV038]|jgi:DNA-binding PadR family transcriptional regulator|uniref:PadR family transcriptional regulator n=1 Tax=unclassified Cupriavidus TaxID=2640874 RepID=UPI0008ED0FA7|nr:MULTISPECIES: PadR family transcriptional regulator [unclassified Cupriavidus]SFC53390.1 DNA-binding transcriptional regulator, PadR family [Cupriavidus sp. OV038]SFP48748.1 DNA-binding transcriptional regulator, PadR family [Cupriavidus sp. OV096]